ncbi:PTS transporter subunit EIIC [Enterococcus gilvus]|nr:PTS transporter subunit EIIC [Enterococcus gilvus]OJG38172.1 PTS system, lactose/cellobiose family IIC component [Enterococcus gilvus]
MGSFSSLIPGILLITLFLVISKLISMTSFGNLHAMIFSLIQTPLQNIGGSFPAILFMALLAQLLWFFGIHGSMVVFSVMSPILGAMDAAQLTAFSSGQPLPNVLGMSFFTIFTFSGTAIALSILMLFAKSKQFKTLGKLGIVPSIFAITEPLIFGTPLILNPIFAIPFILGNVISLVLSYVATIIGIIPQLNGIAAPAGTPIIIQGLIAGGWKIALFQAFLLVIWILLWLPFFKVADAKNFKEENAELTESSK